MARSMACELGVKKIRVNSLSPGHIYTKWVRCVVTVIGVLMRWRNRMTAQHLDRQPELLDKWSSMNPLGRIGRPDELRGAVTWLASNASTFCTGSEWVSPWCSAYLSTDVEPLASL